MNNKEIEFDFIDIFIFKLKLENNFLVVNKKRRRAKRVFQKGRRNDLEKCYCNLKAGVRAALNIFSIQREYG